VFFTTSHDFDSLLSPLTQRTISEASLWPDSEALTAKK
jgi:hypothetical protein